jgi:CBS domain containing-hemolysin-like protein
MTPLLAVVVLLIVFGSVLAAAEASISRMTKVRALALKAEGRRNAGLLERIESDPPAYLNAVYLAVMFVQNGSAILVALIAESYFQNDTLILTLASVTFTIIYFVVVEAMSKTFGILHSDRAALALAPVVFFLGRALSGPTRLLIGLANVLLPGKGLKQGPFVSEEDIRSMAEVGHEEGSIDAQERELIHSVFTFGDTLVREVMVPRPDIVAIDVSEPITKVLETLNEHGYSRMPVYRNELDHIEGVVYAKDVLRVLAQNREDDMPLVDAIRPPHFVPESKRVADLLREMQRHKFHIAIVTDEYGSVSGLVTLEDLLEELVGDIADEYDPDEPEMVAVADGVFRVDGAMPIHDLNEKLGVKLPDEEWDTVGGLLVGLLGAIPREGQEVRCENLIFRAERVVRRRVESVLVTAAPAEPESSQASG